MITKIFNVLQYHAARISHEQYSTVDRMRGGTAWQLVGALGELIGRLARLFNIKITSKHLN